MKVQGQEYSQVMITWSNWNMPVQVELLVLFVLNRSDSGRFLRGQKIHVVKTLPVIASHPAVQGHTDLTLYPRAVRYSPVLTHVEHRSSMKH